MNDDLPKTEIIKATDTEGYFVFSTCGKIDGEEQAMQILNALAPLSRRDDWWTTDGPVAVIAEQLRRLYGKSEDKKAA